MQTPDYPLIGCSQKESVRDAMQALGLWEFGEVVMHVEPAGDGNMNMVVRVVTTRQRLILKQSRPWVEKYPNIAAPVDRCEAEADFYRLAHGHPTVSSQMPRILAADQRRHLLAIEDLGNASDYSHLYSSNGNQAMPLEQATAWLSKLHAIPLSKEDKQNLGCLELRRLNHHHIFEIPLTAPSVIDLNAVCDGLEALATEIRQWPDVAAKFMRCGERYLQTGDHLLHGDFYPGSWLQTENGFRVIDPEFTLAGPTEFDLAILAAHCVLSGGHEDSAEHVMAAYRRAGGAEVDASMLRTFAAIEIIRRLIGVAQLPLAADLKTRRSMVAIAKSWLS